MRELLRLATVDLSPLRHRDFRYLFWGQTISFLGSQITRVAIPYQVYQLTESPLAVGLLGLVELIPMLSLSLVGGAFADARDRRTMVLSTDVAFTVVSAALLINSLAPSPSLPVIYLLAAVHAGLVALQRPSLDAMVPRLVDRSELTQAGALWMLYGSLGMLVGPAIGGVLIASIGLPATFAVDVLSFSASLFALWRIAAVPPPRSGERPSLRGVLEGLAFASRRPELIGTYVVDMVAMFFAMPMALFPAIAESMGGAGVLGLLYSAPALGAFIATATSGWTTRVHRQGMAVVIAATAWGVAITGFGLVDGVVPALAMLALSGGADAISGIFRSAIWNRTIPDALRGRLAAIEMVSYMSGPSLGNARSGFVADAFGIRASIVSGGMLCVLGCGVCALVLPGFRKYDAYAKV